MNMRLVFSLSLLSVVAGCTSGGLSAVSPARITSELELMAERQEIEEAVAADAFPDADDDGL